MIADLLRFNRDARELLASDRDPSLREWLSERGYSEAFVERLIVPQAAAVWSADPGQLWSFPARFMLEFFDNHGVLGFRHGVLGFRGRPRWWTVTGGPDRFRWGGDLRRGGDLGWAATSGGPRRPRWRRLGWRRTSGGPRPSPRGDRRTSGGPRPSPH